MSVELAFGQSRAWIATKGTRLDLIVITPPLCIEYSKLEYNH